MIRQMCTKWGHHDQHSGYQVFEFNADYRYFRQVSEEV